MGPFLSDIYYYSLQPSQKPLVLREGEFSYVMGFSPPREPNQDFKSTRHGTQNTHVCQHCEKTMNSNKESYTIWRVGPQETDLMS